MSLVFISLAVLTVLQVIVCGFTLPLIFSLSGRILFLMRLLGSVIPIKVSLILEGCHLFFVFLPILMNAGSDDWVNVLLTLLLCAGCSLLYIIDNAMFLYVVEDDDDDKEDSL